MDNKKDEQKDSYQTRIYGEKEYFSYMLKRAEKLSAALYLITDFLSDTEPIKWALREKAVDLISDISLAESAPLSDRLDILDVVSRTIREITTLISIARVSRMVSEMNSDIMLGGYGDLSESLGGHSRVISTADTIVSNILSEDGAGKLPFPENKRHLIGQSAQSMRHGGEKVMTNSTKGQNQNSDVKDKAAGRDSRRESIISLIRKHGVVTIKDISTVISGCSEKTIQRELVSLVKDNVLKREGERRWSRYSLR